MTISMYDVVLIFRDGTIITVIGNVSYTEPYQNTVSTDKLIPIKNLNSNLKRRRQYLRKPNCSYITINGKTL